MPRYRIHHAIAGEDTHIVPGTYARKADARRGMVSEAEQRFPDDRRRTDNPDCIVVWRDGEYLSSVSVERAEND